MLVEDTASGCILRRLPWLFLRGTGELASNIEQEPCWPCLFKKIADVREARVPMGNQEVQLRVVGQKLVCQIVVSRRRVDAAGALNGAHLSYCIRDGIFEVNVKQLVAKCIRQDYQFPGRRGVFPLFHVKVNAERFSVDPIEVHVEGVCVVVGQIDHTCLPLNPSRS